MNKIINYLKTKITKKVMIEFVNVTIGVALTALSYSLFIVPNDIVTGGVSGIGVLLKIVFDGFNPATTVLILNILLLIIGYFFVGKDFFIKTVYGSLAFPLFIELFSKIYLLLEAKVDLDIVQIIICASLLSGFGMGLATKYGGSTGGVEVIQRILFKYLHIPFSVSLYALDGAVIVLGMFIAGNVSNSLYAIIFTFITGAIIDMVVFSGFNKRAVYIISDKKEEIRQKIHNSFDRGLTSIKVVGEYTKRQRDMLLCVLSSGEYYKLRSILDEVDKDAFYFAVRASEVRGEGFSYEKGSHDRSI